jgi:gamma-glutamyl:cysteine ligase YbdK (ATP-grasp superfamily)
MMIVLRKIIEINEVNMEKVRIEKEQSQQLLEIVLDVANSITENIIVATEQTEQLNQEIDATQISMKELTEGTLGAQEAIKEQQRKTSEIDRYVDVAEITNYILETHCYFDDNDILYILDDIEEDAQ